MADASHRMAKPAPQTVALYLPPISHTVSLRTHGRDFFCPKVGAISLWVYHTKGILILIDSLGVQLYY